MMTNEIPDMTEKERQLFSKIVVEKLGIKMPSFKKHLLQSRIAKRMSLLKMNSYGEYLNHLLKCGYDSDEFLSFINVITTNKTDFFRENRHFEYLTSFILPELLKTGAGIKNRINIWSAGCSTGEEPYSIAMTLEMFKSSKNMISLDYHILGTDISSNVLEKAVNAVYHIDKINEVPPNVKKQYFLRHNDDEEPFVRIKPAIRSKVSFRRLNLYDSAFGLIEKFDIVFCRNVMIYFDKENQEKIIKKITENIKDKGYLFIGHSESLYGFNVKLKTVVPTIYIKQ